MNNILEVKSLSKTYPKSDFCLDNVTFSIPKGSIMGFVGENGAGKTTTIGCILGTLIKDSGDINVFGKEMNDLAVESRDDIGVVYDTMPFPAHFTPNKIANALRHIYTNWDDALYKEYLDKFKLPPKRKVSKLSRGMTMKLAAAIALSHHPKLLILDEATSGLDPIVRDDILDVFLDFVNSGENSILFSSHITSDLEKVADNITFIHDGKIMFSEEKDTLKYSYGIMRLSAAQFDALDKSEIMAYRRMDYQTNVLVTNRDAISKKYPDVVIDSASIEEVMLLLVKGERP